MPRQKSTHVDDPRAVGARLKEARERAGLSQRQLAFPGCSPAYISRIESGDRIPSLQLLRELGRRLGVSEDYLATGEVSPGGREVLVEAEVTLRMDDLDGAEALYERTLAHGRHRAEALAGLGHVAFQRGRVREAIERFEASLALTGGRAADASVAEALGRAHAMAGEPESAIAVFEAALADAEGRDDAIERTRFAILLADALIDSGNFGRAEELLGQALAHGRDAANPHLRMHLFWSQSRLHAERNDFETAARYARTALEMLRLTEDGYRIGRAHQLLAHIEIDRGRAEEALELLEEGWPLLDEAGNDVDRAHFRIEEARALARLGRREEAASLAMQVGALLGDALPEDAARAYTLLGEIFVELDEPERARELYELAVEILERKNPNRYLVDVYAKLAELLESTGQKEAAYEVMKKALHVRAAVEGRS